MKNTVGLMLVAALACAAACPAWAASITLTSSSGDLTLAQALADAGATVADLTGNVYDDIVVAGNGRILFDTDISAYTGTIHVSSGARAVVKALNGLGAASGKVYVADGGALIPDATGFADGTFTMTKGEVHIAGTGPDGVGALVAIANKNQRPGIWGEKIILDGDAQIASRAGGCILDFPKQYSSTSVINLDMNGHTLTLVPQNAYIPVRMVVGNPGHIVVTNANLSMNGYVRLNGTAANTFTLTNNGFLNFFDMITQGQAPWTLVHDTSRTLNVEQTGGRWDGPVQLLKPFKLDARTKNGNNLFNPRFELYGPISGEEGIVINSDVPTRGAGHLYLYSTNSFRGGVVLNENTYLHVMTDGAVPVTGAPIVMTNAFLDVQAPNCSLPSIDCFCSSNTVIPAARVVGTLTKSGNAKLSCFGSDMPEAIDLKAGTLQFTSASNAWYAGVYEGNTNIATWWASGDNTTAVAFFDGSATITNGTQFSVRWSTQSASFPSNGACTYDGWLYCPANEAGTWRFATSIKTTGILYIDGIGVTTRQTTDELHFGNASMAEGWHHFIFRIGRASASTGPNTNVAKVFEGSANITEKVDSDVRAAWVASGLGLAVCRDSEKALAKTTNVVDFAAFPVDPGDGSVLRLVEPGSAAEAALEAEFLAHQRVGSLVAATNTVLDLCGGPLFVGSVTGFPTVVHSTIPSWLNGETPTLTVMTNWTASAAGIASGAAFTVTGGALAFAEGATLTFPDSRTLPDTRGESLAVATATGGIAGLPELVFAEGDRRGILRKSDDGKSLLLTVASGMMVIFR
ncbi:MAG: hypothetical protein IJI36_03120 [Kiritimatiellae bacterium]|nr:hypothetical protein [Kiritimatiellia bacterium]